MPNPYFRFKQFTIYHDKCAMKVGTDGVLLGAWSAIEGRSSVLDIGTGTGLVALMMAQRNPLLSVTAVEIDKDAFLQACENVKASPWGDRVEVCHSDIKEYTTDLKFDLIVSNPPFFTHSLLSTDDKRNLARHTEQLTYKDLLQRASALLSREGELELIFPASEEQNIKKQALSFGLYPCRQLSIYPTPDSPPKRMLLGLSFKEKEPVSEEMIIETARHQYSREYIELTRDFYLKM